MSRRLGAIACLVVAALLAVGAAANLNLDVTGDERRVIDLGVFGFAKGGVFQLTVNHFFIDDPDAVMLDSSGRLHHNESLGFALMVVESAQDARYLRTMASTESKARRECLDSDALAPRDSNNNVLPRFFFRLSNLTMAEVTKQYPSVAIETPGLYALFFFNCKGYNEKGTLKPLPVSFSAEATEYNVGTGGVPNYLSLGHQPLPMLYGFFTLVFAGLAFVWAREMRRNPTHTHRIHYVMLFLVGVKALSLFFETLKYSHYASTGHASVWDFFYYVFLTAKGITLFAVVVLLGSGWSLLKAMLSERDKQLLMFILPAQVVINISLAVVEESNEGTRGWGSWSDILRIADVVCCCVVLLPIVWSIKNLREAAEHDEKALQTLSRMRLFRTFYIAVVAYVYTTRIILAMIEGSLPFRVLWISNLLAELVAVAFYAYSGYQFRPAAENPYLRVQQEDLDEIEMRAEIGGGGGNKAGSPV
uniref:GOST seven transmembrane domain-containing protein n=1 Tax=Neobodo designis TaxID=312471 RepID=A0A6U4W9P7_NEODS|mmetsp:Transcript_4870/g.15408  ORF Transcript_4870/g.15408 Transcript_4870/m.15408 type:complete len:476 (+) Transcript_4870:43-1470(+)